MIENHLKVSKDGIKKQKQMLLFDRWPVNSVSREISANQLANRQSLTDFHLQNKIFNK